MKIINVCMHIINKTITGKHISISSIGTLHRSTACIQTGVKNMYDDIDILQTHSKLT